MLSNIYLYIGAFGGWLWLIAIAAALIMKVANGNRSKN